ncbi:hypothetical protein MBRA1_002808 [Malassezia brasiliensis]|uniref:Uncharacterized protein n=1 Tax=Malassezia brasiliensis TaxID=1821822 RepID=A0AAF0IPH0_9BASI|nr:hypothetical protein MBRA1_002808 [Malassezia brasiliensis]
MNGYFGYRFCYDHELRQVPATRLMEASLMKKLAMLGPEDPENNVYIMGKWSEQLGPTPELDATAEKSANPSTLRPVGSPNIKSEEQTLYSDQNLFLEQNVINIHTPALCNITAFARSFETPVHPIQCRLVTPDEPEERIAYLKEFGMMKDHVHGEKADEDASVDEPLDFDVVPNGATEQVYTLDMFGDEFDDEDVNGLYEILDRVKKESPYYQREAEAAYDPSTTSQSTTQEQAAELVGDEVQINTPMPVRDEL